MLSFPLTKFKGKYVEVKVKKPQPFEARLQEIVVYIVTLLRYIVTVLYFIVLFLVSACSFSHSWIENFLSDS